MVCMLNLLADIALGYIQEREKENANRNRLPSFNISIPLLHKMQA